MKSKKGQFYILIAITLLVYVFAISPPTAQLPEAPDTFKELYQNFMAESEIVINSGIYDSNTTTRMKNYSGTYMEYARTKDIDFKLAYALRDKDEILVVNHLSEPLNITTPSESASIESNNHRTLGFSQNITFNTGGRAYSFVFSKDPDLKVFFRKKEAAETLIHVEGQ